MLLINRFFKEMSGSHRLIQSASQMAIPPWLEVCMSTVKAWCALYEIDYEFLGDAFLNYCPPEIRAHCGSKIYPIVDIARLELIKEVLDQGFTSSMMWADADILIFDPSRLSIETQNGHAFAREDPHEVPQANSNVRTSGPGVNNSFMVFEYGNPILDYMLWMTKEKIVRISPENFNHTVAGPDVMRTLNTMTPLTRIDDIGLLTSYLIEAIAFDNTEVIRSYMTKIGKPFYAANICWSAFGYRHDYSREELNGIYSVAVAKLLESQGAVINQYLQ